MYIITTEGKRINYLLDLSNTLQEENFHRSLNFAISLMANLLNSNSTYWYIFRNLSMRAYRIVILKSNSLILNSVYLTDLSQAAKLDSVYIFIL